MQKPLFPMPLRVLIVADKFKGTLTAEQATAAIAEGWSTARRGDRLELLPMADGGDGFGRVVGRLLGAEARRCPTVDCAGRARDAVWWFAEGTHTAAVETAEVNGLALLPPHRYHPFELDTFGLGAVLKTAIAAGAKRIYLGLGGSGTNDGGFGLARSMGWMFLDSNGRELLKWTDLTKLVRVYSPAQRLSEAAGLVIAVDVNNPLLGGNGATKVFGPQKGLGAPDLPCAEACLAQLSAVASAAFGHDYGAEPGAGAAGGLGFALRAFFQGQFQPGAQLFATLSKLDRRIAEADFVITAEGCFDEQSLMGKGVGTVAALAAAAHKPCLCLAAITRALSAPLSWPYFCVRSIVPLIADAQHATAHATECLRELATRVASET